MIELYFPVLRVREASGPTILEHECGNAIIGYQSCCNDGSLQHTNTFTCWKNNAFVARSSIGQPKGSVPVICWTVRNGFAPLTTKNDKYGSNLGKKRSHREATSFDMSTSSACIQRKHNTTTYAWKQTAFIKSTSRLVLVYLQCPIPSNDQSFSAFNAA